jgi:glycosyltransferase involved in cell wall biosynthesis
MQPDSQSTFKIKLERLNFSHGLADHVFCRLPSIKELIEEHSDGDVKLIHGVLNAPRVRDAHRRALEEEIRLEYAEPDETLLVFAGRLSEEKNVPAAVGVLKELPSSYRLVVVGDGPERDTIKNEIERHGVQERVTMTGELSHEDTLTIIAAADGLLLQSHTESYGAVVFEGLALGCTVFATPVGILTEVEHPRLRIAPIDGFSDNIRSESFAGGRVLDEETLATYSMERFADQILDAINRKDG